MKALRYYARGDLRYEDAMEPSAGPGQVKAKISYAGICGSDLHEYIDGPHAIARDKIPVTLGHEFSGRVVEVGRGVTDFKTGDKVTGLCYWPCGECHFCKKAKYNLCLKKGRIGGSVDGCMAEYMVAPRAVFQKLSDLVSDEFGALIEPLSAAMRAVGRGNIHFGYTVAIVGDGPIALCTLLAVKAAGADVVYVVSKHKSRGAIAAAMGATAVIDINDKDPVQVVRDFTGGLGVDVSFDCAGGPDTPKLSEDLTMRGGTIVLVGATHESFPYHFHGLFALEKSVICSNMYTREFGTTVALLADKKIDPSRLITAKVPLRDAVEKGFEALLANKESNLKILLRIP